MLNCFTSAIATYLSHYGLDYTLACGLQLYLAMKVEEQQASISQLKSEMQIMVAQLREQAAQIEKVSAQLELNKSAPQTVLNDQ